MWTSRAPPVEPRGAFAFGLAQLELFDIGQCDIDRCSIRGMAMLSTFTGAYRAQRAVAKPTRTRTPLLAHLGRLAARALPTWQGLRTFTLSAAGFGALSYAAWLVAVPLGFAAAGVSLLLVEYLTGRP